MDNGLISDLIGRRYKFVVKDDVFSEKPGLAGFIKLLLKDEFRLQ